MEEFILNLKKQILQALNLEKITMEDIDTDARLFEGLGPDSIDVLDLNILLEKNYGLKIHAAEKGKKLLCYVRTMAEYININKK